MDLRGCGQFLGVVLEDEMMMNEEAMTNEEAIKTLEANYPDACFGQLREAVDAAIEALKAQDAAGDTISRKAAIDAIWHSVGSENGELRTGYL